MKKILKGLARGGPSLGIGLGVGLLVAWVLIGTIGFRIIEGWSYVDSFYMTVITISTVGFTEVHELSDTGRLFASLIIVAGLGTAVYTFTRIGQVLLEGELLTVLGRRRMKAELDRLNDHIIVCGYGRIGRPVVDNLVNENVSFCVIDRDDSLETAFEDHGYVHLVADATEDETLRLAGVERARSLLALLPSDADNLYLTITAKSIRPEVAVIARSNDEKSVPKLEHVGADRVISPYSSASVRVLHAAMRPNVVDLIDLVSEPSQMGLMLDEFSVAPGSALDGHTLGEVDIRGRFRVTIVAVRGDGQPVRLHPEPAERISARDIIVAMGQEDDLKRLQDACRS